MSGTRRGRCLYSIAGAEDFSAAWQNWGRDRSRFSARAVRFAARHLCHRSHPPGVRRRRGRRRHLRIAAGRSFLLVRSSNEHESFPDSLGVIGAPEAGDGLVMNISTHEVYAGPTEPRSRAACCAIGAMPPGSTSAFLPPPAATRSWGVAARPDGGRPAGRPEGDLPPKRSRHANLIESDPLEIHSGRSSQTVRV